jgi:hypothetical protein
MKAEDDDETTPSDVAYGCCLIWMLALIVLLGAWLVLAFFARVL